MMMMTQYYFDREQDVEVVVGDSSFSLFSIDIHAVMLSSLRIVDSVSITRVLSYLFLPSLLSSSKNKGK